MDCATCEDELLDLALGECDDARAALLREHAAGCASCGAALARLEGGRALARALPREAAPAVSPALRAAIDRAAREHAAQGALAAAVPPSTAGGTHEHHDRGGRALPRWLEHAGALAMRRQVAMAAVFLLTVGVGLAYYQAHPRHAMVTDARRPDVVPAQEVLSGPSNATAGPSGAPRRPLGVAPGRTQVAERDERARLVPAVRPSLEARAAAAASAPSSPPTTAPSGAPEEPSQRSSAALREALAQATEPAERDRLARALDERQREERAAEAQAAAATVAAAPLRAGSVDNIPAAASNAARPTYLAPRRAAPRPARSMRPGRNAAGESYLDMNAAYAR